MRVARSATRCSSRAPAPPRRGAGGSPMGTRGRTRTSTASRRRSNAATGGTSTAETSTTACAARRSCCGFSPALVAGMCFTLAAVVLALARSLVRVNPWAIVRTVPWPVMAKQLAPRAPVGAREAERHDGLRRAGGPGARAAARGDGAGGGDGVPRVEGVGVRRGDAPRRPLRGGAAGGQRHDDGPPRCSRCAASR